VHALTIPAFSSTVPCSLVVGIPMYVLSRHRTQLQLSHQLYLPVIKCWHICGTWSWVKSFISICGAPIGVRDMLSKSKNTFTPGSPTMLIIGGRGRGYCHSAHACRALTQPCRSLTSALAVGIVGVATSAHHAHRCRGCEAKLPRGMRLRRSFQT
jgi:hypothetical protein